MEVDIGQIFTVLQSWAPMVKYKAIYDHLKMAKNDFVGPTLWKMVKIEFVPKMPKMSSRGNFDRQNRFRDQK